MYTLVDANDNVLLSTDDAEEMRLEIAVLDRSVEHALKYNGIFYMRLPADSWLDNMYNR